MILVLFVFRPQCNSLVNLLLGQALTEQGRTVLLERLLVHLFSQVLEASGLAVFVHDLLSKHVDLFFILLVLGLRLVEAELLIFARVLLPIEANVVPLVIHSLGPYLVDILLLFSELVLHLLDLVLKNLQLALLILKLLSVNVDFPLKSSRFALVNRVVTATHRATCNR